MNGLKTAIFIAGSQKNLARLLGVKPQTVSYWVSSRKGVVPANRAVQIESVLEGKVSKESLCPKVFDTSKQNNFKNKKNTPPSNGHSYPSDHLRIFYNSHY